MNLLIDQGTQVTLHFALALESGDVVDSNFDSQPATFTLGDGNLLPGFEQVLMGLSAGYDGEFTLKPEQGFGARNPNNLQEFPRDQFSEEELNPGVVLAFSDAQQNELPGVVAVVEADSVTVDFNHPLAGKTILFKVKILDVKPAVRH